MEVLNGLRILTKKVHELRPPTHTHNNFQQVKIHCNS